MTKVTILGSESKESKKLKPIEFVKQIVCDENWTTDKDDIIQPDQWRFIELIALRFDATFDLMYAYDFKRSDGAIYLGHFNDGVVE